MRPVKIVPENVVENDPKYYFKQESALKVIENFEQEEVVQEVNFTELNQNNPNHERLQPVLNIDFKELTRL